MGVAGSCEVEGFLWWKSVDLSRRENGEIWGFLGSWLEAHKLLNQKEIAPFFQFSACKNP